MDADIFHRGLIEQGRGGYPERDWEADARIGMVLQRLLLAAGGGGEDGGGEGCGCEGSSRAAPAFEVRVSSFRSCSRTDSSCPRFKRGSGAAEAAREGLGAPARLHHGYGG